MKVLVTGGLGYIGSHAVYLLIEKGDFATASNSSIFSTVGGSIWDIR